MMGPRTFDHRTDRYFLLARGWTTVPASHKSDYPSVDEYAAAVPFWNEGSAKQRIVVALRTQVYVAYQFGNFGTARSNSNPSS
jgi:hypothetical protein